MWKLSVIADAAFCAANPVQQQPRQQPWQQRGRGRGSRNQFDSYAHIICITLFAHPPSALNFQIPNKSASEMLFHAFHPAVFALSFTFSFTLHSGSASCVSGCQSPVLSSSLSLSCFEVTAADFHSRWFLALTVSSFASLTDPHLIYDGFTVSVHVCVCACEWLCNWPNWRMSNMEIE